MKKMFAILIMGLSPAISLLAQRHFTAKGVQVNVTAGLTNSFTHSVSGTILFDKGHGVTALYFSQSDRTADILGSTKINDAINSLALLYRFRLPLSPTFNLNAGTGGAVLIPQHEHAGLPLFSTLSQLQLHCSPPNNGIRGVRLGVLGGVGYFWHPRHRLFYVETGLVFRFGNDY